VAGVFIVGKCCNGQFYEVAVCKSYIPWLLDYKFEFQLDLDFDRTEPADAEAQVYGISRARARAQAHFLQNAIEAIWSRRSQELVLYYRRIAPSKLKIPLEWVILNHDVLVSSTAPLATYSDPHLILIRILILRSESGLPNGFSSSALI
jgi:hypothetical protein